MPMAHPSPHSPNQNHLLGALPTVEFERLAPHLELVPMPLGEILYEPGSQMRHAYFPTTAILSLQPPREEAGSCCGANAVVLPCSFVVVEIATT